MSVGSRLTLGGLVLAGIAVVVGTTVVPTHVTRGAGSLRCGTVLHPDRNSEIAPLCGPAGANHLRATLVVGAVLVGIAVLPLILDRTHPGRHAAVWAAWGAIMVVAAVVGVASLALGEYAPDHAFFDL